LSLNKSAIPRLYIYLVSKVSNGSPEVRRIQDLIQFDKLSSSTRVQFSRDSFTKGSASDAFPISFTFVRGW
jgi:hypothetical protein